jgi:zinc D-Ala-D-Ala carboxypeptidase
MSSLDWSQYPSFSLQEMQCKHTGKCEMKHEFMLRLQQIRNDYGKPMRVTSGFRDVTHPIEAAKAAGGPHITGMAVDIAVGPGEDAYDLADFAFRHGFTGIGISQRAGRPRFVHLDTLPRKAIWSY